MNNQRNIPHRCSFCRNREHDIRNCNDVRFLEFAEECSTRKIGYDNFTNNSVNQSKIKFREWLISYSLRSQHNIIFIKSFAVRNCNAIMNNDVVECIEKIVYYYYDTLPIIPVVSLESIQAEANTNGIWYNYINYFQNNFNVFMNDNIFMSDNIFMNDYLDKKDTINIHKIIVNSKITEETSDLDSFIECAICYNEKKERNFIKTNCNHKICSTCFVNYSKSKMMEYMVPCCALCRTNITLIEIYDEDVKEEISCII